MNNIKGEKSMKPFLGIDLTNDRKNEEHNGGEFIVARPSLAMAQAVVASVDRVEETIERSRLPRPLRIVKAVCGFAAIFVIIAILRALTRNDGLTIAFAYANAPVLFWGVGACTVVWGVLAIISRSKEKAVLDTDESERVFSNLDGICTAAFDELEVPDSAKDTDLIAFGYKEKNGKIKPYEGMKLTPYTNPMYKLFADSENLYIANLEGKYAFPLSSLAAIQTVKKNIRLPEWNKDVPYDKGIYKQYKIYTNRYEHICCKKYHILEINLGSEQWGIYFPNYELPTFEEVTGLKAQ